MFPLLYYKIFILDVEQVIKIIHDIINIKNQRDFKDKEKIIVGIYIEDLKNIRQEIFSYLINFCKISNIHLIFFDIPVSLRIHFYLENIPIRLGCAFFELFESKP